MEPQKQDDVIEALLISKNYTEASKIANVSRKTIYNYLNDVDFIKRFKEAKRIKLRETISKIEYASNKAVDCIIEIIDSSEISPNLKLNASIKLLDFFPKYREIEGDLNNIMSLENENPYDFPLYPYSNTHY